MGAREPRGHLPGGEPPLRSGSSLPGGRYAVTELLDAGPVLMAYLARDRWAEEEVLIHELLPIGCRRGPTAGPGANPYEATLHALRPAFLESVSRLMGVARPGLLEARDSLQDEGVAYGVWAYREGRPFSEWARLSGADTDALSDLWGRLIGAVDACHRAGVLHLGIDGRAVRVDTGGQVLLLPPMAAHWEFARHTGCLDAFAAAPGVAPEIRRGDRPTAAADVYSLAALLEGVLRGPGRRAGADAPPARIRLALAEDPALRPSLADLAQVSFGQGKRAMPESPPERKAPAQLVDAPLIERIGPEPDPPATELGWQADRVRWASHRAEAMDPGVRERLGRELDEALSPVAASHPSGGPGTEYGCIGILVAVLVWFTSVTLSLDPFAGKTLIVGSLLALVALVGTVATLTLWHRSRVRSAATRLMDRFPRGPARDDAIALLYERRESSLAATEVLDVLERTEQGYRD